VNERQNRKYTDSLSLHSTPKTPRCTKNGNSFSVYTKRTKNGSNPRTKNIANTGCLSLSLSPGKEVKPPPPPLPLRLRLLPPDLMRRPYLPQRLQHRATLPLPEDTIQFSGISWPIPITPNHTHVNHTLKGILSRTRSFLRSHLSTSFDISHTSCTASASDKPLTGSHHTLGKSYIMVLFTSYLPSLNLPLGPI
jgi:hypothetical protein